MTSRLSLPSAMGRLLPSPPAALDPKQSPLQGLRDRILGDESLELTARDLMDTWASAQHCMRKRTAGEGANG